MIEGKPREYSIVLVARDGDTPYKVTLAANLHLSDGSAAMVVDREYATLSAAMEYIKGFISSDIECQKNRLKKSS